MEKEPKIEKSLEERLREKGYIIEPIGERNWAQCDKENCFSEAKWFIEGSFYCPEHKEGAIKVIEEIDKDIARRRSEQERIMEERRKRSEQTMKDWAKKGENIELKEKLEQKRKELKERRKNEGSKK